jgi:hypothetical protein
MNGRKIGLLVLFAVQMHVVTGQIPYSDNSVNTITTAVPFAGIITNTQSRGMGCLGVVASDLYTHNGLEQNPALLSRGKKVSGFEINYMPWLRKLVPDLNLYEAGFFHSVNENNAFGISLVYFDLGEILLTNNQGLFVGQSNPWELMVSLKYAHSFSEHFSMGAGIRYIHSDLTNDLTLPGGLETHAGQSVAGDLGFDYRNYLLKRGNVTVKIDAGLAILNIGSKVKYTDSVETGDFIPQIIKVGTMFTTGWMLKSGNYLALDVAYQADKLLVPSPPVYEVDINGNIVFDSNNEPVIAEGMDPDVGVMKGIVQSFYDAPGGVEEELHEIMHMFATEARVIFLQQRVLTAIRAGYFHEHETKGNRKFYTLGLGGGYAGLRLDFSYLFPVSQRSPLENTWSISLSTKFNLGSDQFFRFVE